jgi:hypothetical protein
MGDHCGLESWQHNSEVWMASSPTVEGPYVPNGQVLPAFSHEPVLTRANDGTWLIFHIGSADNTTKRCTGCTSGSTPPGACDSADENGDLPPVTGSETPTLAYASDPRGPWTVLSGGSGGYNFNNPAPVVLANGTVLLYWKAMINNARTMALARAPSWRGPFEQVTVTDVIGEDPVVWQQNGTFHMLFHTCCDDKIPSTAWSEDGISWHVTPGAGHNANPFPAFTKDIALTNGSTIQLQRRERHQVAIDARTGLPLGLFNGAQPVESTDYIFTSFQPFAQA